MAASRGARFLNSGYHFTVTGQPPGWYRFVVSSHSWPSGAWTGRTVDAYVDIPTVSLEINRSGTGTGSIVATGLSCPGGSNTQAMPCGASYALGSVVWLTAVADPGSTFAGWGGGCLGTQPTCGVTLAGDRYTFAYFTKTPDTVATTYYHTDAIGSVRALSDDTGATVIRHDYLPFGEDTQPLTGDPMRFAGKELDPESALMNFEARYYRNTWGRFTQVDPLQAKGALTDPQNWNRYAYAGNNPLRFVDPFGSCQYDPQTDRFTDTNGCVSLTVTAPYPDVVGAQVCYGYNANGEKYQQVSCSDQAIPGGGAYSGIGAQPGKSYPLVYPSASTRPSTPSPTPVPTPTPTPKPPTPNPKPPTPSPTPSEVDHQNFFEYLLSQPWVLSGILPLGPVPGVYGVGPAVSFAWNPQTRNACASVGLGMSAGHNVAIGPLTYVDGRADSVLDGMSASLGLNLPFPPVGGIGGQITFGASGVAAGVTAGVPGASGSVTWSTCTNRGQ